MQHIKDGVLNGCIVAPFLTITCPIKELGTAMGSARILCHRTHWFRTLVIDNVLCYEGCMMSIQGSSRGGCLLQEQEHAGAEHPGEDDQVSPGRPQIHATNAAAGIPGRRSGAAELRKSLCQPAGAGEWAESLG